MSIRILLPATALVVSCSSGLGPVVPKTPVERQMIGLLEKLDSWDDDGDGGLDRSEIDRGIASLRGRPQEVGYTTDQVMEFYDTNRDGKISIAEGQAGYGRSVEAEKFAKP